MNASTPNSDTEKTCPYLGLSFDPQTALAYPSSQNLCHHVTPTAAPGAAYQGQFCLELLHTQCERYVEKSASPIPAEFLLGENTNRHWNPQWIRFLPLGLLILILLSGSFWLMIYLSRQKLPIDQPAIQTTSPAAVAILSPTLTQTLQPSPTHTQLPSHTLEPTATLTPTPYFLHFLETPIGNDRPFLMHRVVAGESLIKLAGMFNTSIDAIRAVNIDLQGLLWSNTVIVIPVNQVDVTGVVPMLPYEVVTDGLALTTLADEQNVKLEFLAQLNHVFTSHVFQLGEWVLVPQEQPTP